MRSAFSFHTQWVVPVAADEVQAVLVDLEHYPDWWPQVVAVARIDDHRTHVRCRSRLPYTLDLELTSVREEPRLLESRIRGDLVGVAMWRLEEVGGMTRIDYSQDVVVSHGMLRQAARVLRPVMEWNHARMMEGCLAGLLGRLGLPG